MSWPNDGLPRFKATEPYPMGSRDAPLPSDPWRNWWQAEILDRAYCHQIVEVVRTQRQSEIGPKLALRLRVIEASE